MRERARLLKYGPRDPAWLDGLENEMAEAGVEIARARKQTVERLNRSLSERTGAFPSAALSLEGEGFEDTARLRDALASARLRDAEAGRTLKGPHLADLNARHTAKRADARECSTGEQKALLISIMLADARELARARDGLAPLLLLDEVAAHLDAARRAALFEEIGALGAQAWMTGTDLSLFDGLSKSSSRRAEIFLVENGQFTRQE
jgi:DNA replication and repair protein RecF